MSITSYAATTGEAGPSFEEDSSKDVRRTVAAAAAAAPALARALPRARSRWLEAVASAMETASDELVALADLETGLGTERLRGEVTRTAGQLRFYAAVAEEGSYLGVVHEPASPVIAAMTRCNIPLGPVAVFGASNFPFAFGVLGNDTGSALAAGCPVVAKAHPAHMRTSLALADLATGALLEAGAPAGAFGLVVGQEAGAELVRSDGVAAVAFTGSQQGGMALWRLANEREVVIPVFAEMGTVNPAVVTPSATEDLASVVQGFVSSFTLGSGQFCTKPGLLLVPAGHSAAQLVADELDRRSLEPVMLTESIAGAVRAGLERLKAAGAEVVARTAAQGRGWRAPAAVLSAPADALVSGSALVEECFGAVALVVEYADRGQLEKVLGHLQGALAGAVLTSGPTDPDGLDLMGLLAAKVGRVVVDGWPTGVAFNWAQQHGGPWPATSVPSATSVGAAALDRFVRPVAFQGAPDAWLPAVASADNPAGVTRRTGGHLEPWSVSSP